MNKVEHTNYVQLMRQIFTKYIICIVKKEKIM